MAYTTSSLLCMALALTFCSTIEALDITATLATNPELTLFNKALTETKLAEEINKLNGVTILAVNNSGMETLAGKSQAAVKAILSTSVLPGYYTEKMLYETIGPHTEVETLFQSTGAAIGRQGYIYVAFIGEGEMVFVSAAAPNGPYEAYLMGMVVDETNVVAVFQVTNPIIAPGIEAVADSLAASSGGVAKVLPLALANGEGVAVSQSPSALAPAPAPSSSSSRVYFGFFAALSALASLLVLA